MLLTKPLCCQLNLSLNLYWCGSELVCVGLSEFARWNFSADVCGRMLTYANVCGRMLTYADGAGGVGQSEFARWHLAWPPSPLLASKYVLMYLMYLIHGRWCGGGGRHLALLFNKGVAQGVPPPICPQGSLTRSLARSFSSLHSLSLSLAPHPIPLHALY